MPGAPIGSDGPLHRRALVVCRLIKGTFHFILQAIERERALDAVARTLWASLGKIRSTMDATRTTAMLNWDGISPRIRAPKPCNPGGADTLTARRILLFSPLNEKFLSKQSLYIVCP